MTTWPRTGSSRTYAGFATGDVIGRSSPRMVAWLDKVLPRVKKHAAGFEGEGEADWAEHGQGSATRSADDKSAHQIDLANLPKATADVSFDRAQVYTSCSRS